MERNPKSRAGFCRLLLLKLAIYSFTDCAAAFAFAFAAP
jgi:hypothetical protein